MAHAAFFRNLCLILSLTYVGAVLRETRTIVLLVGESRSVSLTSKTWNNALFQPFNVKIGLCNSVTEKYQDTSLPRAILDAIPGVRDRIVFERPYISALERDAPAPRVNHSCPSTCRGVTTNLPIPTRFKPQRVGNRGLNMDQARNLLTCYLALQEHEANVGVKYDIVVKLRLDAALWRRIPALNVYRLLTAATVHPTAIFTQHPYLDYFGIADRFWISNRAAADVLFTSWLVAPRFYATGHSLAALFSHVQKYFCTLCLNTTHFTAEEIMLNHLRVHNVTILREYFMDYNSLIAHPSGCARWQPPEIIDIFSRMDIDFHALKIDPHVDCNNCCP